MVELLGLGRLLREVVVFDEKVPIGGKYERDVMPLGCGGVSFALLQPRARCLALGLGLDIGDCDGLRVQCHAESQRIINPPAWGDVGNAVDDFDTARRLFAADEVLRPLPPVQLWVNQLRASVGLAEKLAIRVRLVSGYVRHWMARLCKSGCGVARKRVGMESESAARRISPKSWQVSCGRMPWSSSRPSKSYWPSSGWQ